METTNLKNKNMKTKQLNIVSADAFMHMDELTTWLTLASQYYRRIDEDKENEGHLNRVCGHYLDLLPKVMEDLKEFEKIARLQLLGLNPPYDK